MAKRNKKNQSKSAKLHLTGIKYTFETLEEPALKEGER